MVLVELLDDRLNALLRGADTRQLFTCNSHYHYSYT